MINAPFDPDFDADNPFITEIPERFVEVRNRCRSCFVKFTSGDFCDSCEPRAIASLELSADELWPEAYEPNPYDGTFSEM
jgi:hypothetical protein